ncbi:MAG: hypothetical protein IPF99_35170 [Deltaproteobacteria bacterium]|jgi:hypothetical protein|nr:hypothetical protein [Deltaproteobacteria bacterium]
MLLLVSMHRLPHMVDGHELRHVPVAQTWPVEQTRPQTPQFVGAVFKSVSHPLEGSASQAPKPGTHANSQVPPEQTGNAWLGAGH